MHIFKSFQKRTFQVWKAGLDHIYDLNDTKGELQEMTLKFTTSTLFHYISAPPK